MQNGISVYLGLDNTFEENMDLIHTAASYGIQRVFTSFHIPETNLTTFKSQAGSLFNAAKSKNMEIITDVSPKMLTLLGMEKFSLSAMQFLGVTTIRLDDGYSIEEIARFSRNPQKIKIQLNASTITSKMLMELMQQNANFSNMEALHNFYPREGTGLAEETLVRKTSLLHKAGIRTGAFVPSHYRRRSPLKEGLPTLEMHRNCDFSLAVRHLCAIGMDSIFIGDSLPSTEEMQLLSAAPEDIVTMKLKLSTQNDRIREILTRTFTARIDEARDAIRTQESRQCFQGMIVEPENTKVRSYGAVTVDNKDYLRYMGELQIIKRPQPADKRVNVVGNLLPEEDFLIHYIIPGREFRFECI